MRARALTTIILIYVGNYLFKLGMQCSLCAAKLHAAVMRMSIKVNIPALILYI